MLNCNESGFVSYCHVTNDKFNHPIKNLQIVNFLVMYHTYCAPWRGFLLRSTLKIDSCPPANLWFNSSSSRQLCDLLEHALKGFFLFRRQDTRWCLTGGTGVNVPKQDACRTDRLSSQHLPWHTHFLRYVWALFTFLFPVFPFCCLLFFCIVFSSLTLHPSSSRPVCKTWWQSIRKDRTEREELELHFFAPLDMMQYSTVFECVEKLRVESNHFMLSHRLNEICAKEKSPQTEKK